MSTFDPDQMEWKHKSGGSEQPQPIRYTIDYRALELDSWAKLGCVWGGKIIIAVMFAASFMPINPIAVDVFIGDFLPVPDVIGDISMGGLINFGLGLLAVTLPTILWKHALDRAFQSDPKAYFTDAPMRIVIASVLGVAYGLIIALEVLALRSRITASLDQGPIATISEQPEVLPMAIASGALILGSCLLGLASAALTNAIHERYATRLP
ncbi:hypothetical protein NBRC116494_06740 [Aurantivibrio plasticivorans]